jgi:putative component of toxin-antitoxin plasmid stabilization module
MLIVETPGFSKWLRSLADERAKGRIVARIDR